MPSGYSDFGEDYIRSVLQKKGWFVIPTGKISDGGAPMARSCGDAIIIPDLQIMAGGRMRWVEVKRKTNPAYMRIEQCYKHGFCARQYDHYLECESEASVQVWIFIWETAPRQVCFAPLGYLKHPQRRQPKPFIEPTKQNSDFCNHGMVFF